MRVRRRQRGAALLTAFAVLTLLGIAAAAYIDSSTATIRQANRQVVEMKTVALCEAGVQTVLRSLWRPFKTTQAFDSFDLTTNVATANNPAASALGTVPGVGKFASGVISYSNPDTYTRVIVVRSVGWIDTNNDGLVQASEAQKTVDVVATFQLARSQVFDFAYFVNNYGWMDGFGVNDLIVNGDMRANGNFNFTNGSPTVNGSVYACSNDKLSPPAAGLVNVPPVKWDQNTYINNATGGDPDNQKRWRQGYDPAKYGAKGSAQYETWRDLLFDTTGSIITNKLSGAVIADANGERAWQRTYDGASIGTTTLDTTPTQEVIMPDLSDITYYEGLSGSYVDGKVTFKDGTANPDYGNGSYLDVWDSTANNGAGGYTRLTTNGTINGSAVVVGTDAHPVKIHGPVSVTQDVVIKGTVQGQGTLYTGRNIHVVGSIRYKTKPNFQGSDPNLVDQQNEKADLLGLAARGCVMLGDPTQFGWPYPLSYMTPPFTHGRYDENGNWIPAFDATQVDTTGRMRYQSVISDNIVHSLGEGVNQIDAIMYTNFVGGGDIGMGGNGVTLNGSIISRDEAMITWSLPMRQNYDSRVRERSLTQKPLIDINLPRSPVMLRSSWQDRGFRWTSQ